jgi:cysteine desulfurase
MSIIYLDNNSTTPLEPSILGAMLPYLRDEFANPSSAHSLGEQSRKALEEARAKVGQLVDADPAQVMFTSSATESINTVFNLVTSGRVIISSVEHSSTLECAKRLEHRGIDVVTVPVNEAGLPSLDALADAITSDTRLVSMMWANNETGSIFPINDIACICSDAGAPLHVDAAQAAGKLPISLFGSKVTYLSISSHKMFGPKGAAALIFTTTAKLLPLIVGGGQEWGYRAGTENVPAIVGFGEAAYLAKREMSWRTARAKKLRDRLELGILSATDLAYVNGGTEGRLSNTSNLGFRGIDGDALVSLLDARGLCVSTGSACHSRTMSPSHVILAMHGSYEKATEAVRFSVSHMNSDAEIDQAIAATIDALSIMS